MSRDDRTLLDQINELRRDVDGLRASVAFLTGAMRGLKDGIADALSRAADAGMVPRESGGSLPDPDAAADRFVRAYEAMSAGHPPLLNKGGGSDVAFPCDCVNPPTNAATPGPHHNPGCRSWAGLCKVCHRPISDHGGRLCVGG